MTKFALYVQLDAKRGKEQQVADFLTSALPLVQAEPGTTAWFAIKMGPSTFGIFDAFPDEAGREAHLAGRVAEALMAKPANYWRVHRKFTRSMSWPISSQVPIRH
jgi:quinol monooxygenase YgiN